MNVNSTDVKQSREVWKVSSKGREIRKKRAIGQTSSDEGPKSSRKKALALENSSLESRMKKLQNLVSCPSGNTQKVVSQTSPQVTHEFEGITSKSPIMGRPVGLESNASHIKKKPNKIQAPTFLKTTSSSLNQNNQFINETSYKKGLTTKTSALEVIKFRMENVVNENIGPKRVGPRDMIMSRESTSDAKIPPKPMHNDLSEILQNMTNKINCLKDQNEEIIGLNKEIIQQNNQIRVDYTNINENLDFLRQELATGEERFDHTLFQPLEGFPLSNLEDFEQMETARFRPLRKKLFDRLVKRGGVNLRGFISNAIKLIMTDGLVNQFVWSCKAKKLPTLENTKITNVIFTAAQHAKLFGGVPTESTFAVEMQNMLRCTKQRYRNSLKKRCAPNAPADQSEEELNAEVHVEDQVSRILDDGSGPEDSELEESGSESNEHTEFEDLC